MYDEKMFKYSANGSKIKFLAENDPHTRYKHHGNEITRLKWNIYLVLKNLSKK